MSIPPLAKKPATKSQGFSIIELMVVLGILMTIATTALPQLGIYINNAYIARMNQGLSLLFFQNLQMWEEHQKLPSTTRLKIDHNTYDLDWTITSIHFGVEAIRISGGYPPCSMILDLQSTGRSDNNCNGAYEADESW